MLQDDILNDLHAGTVGGHMGEEKLGHQLLERFYYLVRSLICNSEYMKVATCTDSSIVVQTESMQLLLATLRRDCSKDDVYMYI